MPGTDAARVPYRPSVWATHKWGATIVKARTTVHCNDLLPKSINTLTPARARGSATPATNVPPANSAITQIELLPNHVYHFHSFMAPPGSALNPNTTVESSSHPPNMPTGTQDSAAKPTSSALKRKITANNKLKTRQKRVKRESDASMLQTGGGETSLEVNKAVKRAQTRGKLAMLPSLPFDVLFEHAKMCQEWFSALVVARNEQLDQIRIDRYNFIHDRLVKMGYKLEFEFLWDLDSGRNVVPPLPDLKPFRSHAEVRISKPITERTWNSRVKDVMVEYMEDAKKHRLINGRRLLLLRRSASALQAWLSWLAEEAQIAKYPPGTLLPTPVDFVQSQCVQLSIHQDDNAELFPTDFASAIQKFTTTLWEATDSRSPLDSWREAQEGVLWDLICDNPDDMDTIPDISEYFTSLETEYRLQWLQLAVVTFSCNTPNSDVHRYPQIVDDPSCAAPSAETIRAKWRAHGVTTPGRKNASNARDPMWYPEFFHHSCCKLQWTSPADESFKHNNLYVVQRLQISPISWIRMQELSLRKTLRFDHAASKTVKNILVACGLNWERTKVQDLDEIDPRVKHSLEKHWGSAEVRWQRLSDQDASNARKKEKFERLERCARTEITPVPRPLRCLLCRDSPDEAGPMTWDDMCDHLVGRLSLAPATGAETSKNH
ncbi:hypothetical protein EST38_g10914 [Candolleomyces aberdarensis]|uniref:Uncharacterized protein n=1 Tax=Candolleomyces aberdarensis TaxID=2316362 RepID=A0A4Q2D8K5_9AGAR|nr:hypothetical protein EST38_g10914 [Candolleomyces aberdarensis]